MTGNEAIPDEAVEAAACDFYMSGPQGNDMHWDDLPRQRKRYFLRRAKIALEAAAPHLMAQAWDEGATNGWKQSGEGWNAEYPDESTGECSVLLAPNPYRTTK